MRCVVLAVCVLKTSTEVFSGEQYKYEGEKLGIAQGREKLMKWVVHSDELEI